MLKKLTALFLAALLLNLLPALPSSAAASTAPKLAVYVDKENHSFIPLRVLNDFAGITSLLNNAGAIEIKKGNASLQLTPGQAAATVNGKPRTLSERPFNAGGSMYVPLSLVSSTLGISLQWNKSAASLTLTAGDDSVTLPVLSGVLPGAGGPAISSSARTYKVGSRTFKVQTVTVSLLHPSVKLDVVLAGDKVGRTEALNSIAKRSNAAVAINGTFFDAYTDGAYKAPYGYLVSGGTMLKNSPGDRRTVFAYDRNLLTELIPGSDFMARFNAGTVEGALQAGPRLVVNGAVALNVAAEGFKDPKIQTGGGARSALGITRDHKLILLTSGGATIRQLAEIMKQAGAYQAMNLDGGASSGLYYNGKYLTTPGRLISNALVIQTR